MPQVTVQEGILLGKETTTCYGQKYYSFQGIPYAKPPVGKLRFRNPEEPESWTGIRDATKAGNKAPQLNPYAGTSLDGSEDCLYLNVFTPSLPKEKLEKLPVIFFVHGGRLIVGYGDYYNPDYLIRNDVILVTLNYRLNIFGFLCLDLPEAPGNAGIKDCVLALKWVKKNIDTFNGDPDNVTIFGESAGSALISSFLTSKMTEGLFHKMICQSGNLLSDLFFVHEDPIEKAKFVCSNLGKDLTDPRDMYNFLIDVPYEDLVYAFTAAEMSRPPSIIHAYFLPVLEKKFDGVDRFFDEYPLIALKQNRFWKVPILAGFNMYEAALFVTKDEKDNLAYEKDFEYFIPSYLFVEKGSKRALDFATRLKHYYFKDKDVGDETKLEYINMISDLYFNRDSLYFVELMSKFVDMYFFRFDYCGNMNTRIMKKLGVKGTTHGDLIQYQFYRKSKAAQCKGNDQKIVDFLSEAWCNFAKCGKPTWKNQELEWPPYTPRQRNCLVIDDKKKLITNYGLESLHFWMGLGQRSKI